MTTTFTKTEPILTVNELKKRFFFGVDLRDRDGNILPDSTFEKHIIMAIDWLENQLEVNLYPTTVEHFSDYRLAEYRQWCFIQVDKYPILSVQEVELKFSDQMKITFPSQWYKIYENSGQVQLLPTASTLSAVIIAQTGALLPRAVPGEFAPQLMRVAYTAGFSFDALPPLINETIGLRATNQILNILGDITPMGPSVGSYSQNIDGLSQSVSSVLPLYNVRIQNNEKNLEMNIKLLRKKYKRCKLAHI